MNFIIIQPSDVLFGIKDLNKLWKKTFKTIHQLSCYQNKILSLMSTYYSEDE